MEMMSPRYQKAMEASLSAKKAKDAPLPCLGKRKSWPQKKHPDTRSLPNVHACKGWPLKGIVQGPGLCGCWANPIATGTLASPCLQSALVPGSVFWAPSHRKRVNLRPPGMSAAASFELNARAHEAARSVTGHCKDAFDATLAKHSEAVMLFIVRWPAQSVSGTCSPGFEGLICFGFLASYLLHFRESKLTSNINSTADML